MSRAPLQAQLEELSPRECVQLLAAHRFGRIAFAADGLPLILPVNYLYCEPSIVIRTGPGSKLEQTPQTMVAFEIDEVDPGGDWGWSVVAQGPAFDISGTIDQLSEALRKLPVIADPPGVRDHWLKIGCSSLTGRWFGRYPLDQLSAQMTTGGSR